MSSYAVLWRPHPGRSMPGSLELRPDALHLEGGGGGSQVLVDVSYREIESVTQATAGARRELVVERRDAGSIVISSVSGGGELGEILEALVKRSQAARRHAAELRQEASPLRARAQVQAERARKLNAS